MILCTAGNECIDASGKRVTAEIESVCVVRELNVLSLVCVVSVLG